jgi:protein-S-isoprenylcysteine O-methyltransferase Ste14
MIYVIFCLPVTDVNLTWRTLFLLYLVAGAYLEERKLLAEFGTEYARYQQEVPMFWPRWRG